jgi:2-polyprenyl-3-methyl-5-hydroxy-6-metoxy-1,4-benzoquinol methylase
MSTETRTVKAAAESGDPLTPDTIPSPEPYFDTIFAFQRSAALNSAIELDLFTAIAEGARTMQAVAAACEVPERGVRVLCDYLVTLGFLDKAGDLYDVTPVSAAFLSKRSPAYLGGTAKFQYAQLTGYFEQLTETIRRGTVQQSMVSDEHPAWVEFARAMVPMMIPAAQAIAELLDANSGTPMRVLDIAAGHGIFGIVLAQRNPNAEIVAVDWPEVLEVAAENALAMGVASRHRTLAGDAFTVDCGTGYDVVLITNFLHHFDRPTNVALLKKVAGTLKPDGRVVILEFVPNEDRVSPPMAARFSLIMLATTPSGDAYTFEAFRGMLGEAGFADVTAHPLPGPQTVLLAAK